MDEKDRKISKLQSLIITLCTVIVGLSSYIFYTTLVKTPPPARCEYNGWAYADGESFPAVDDCNTCVCSDGEVICTEMYCTPNSSICGPEDSCED